MQVVGELAADQPRAHDRHPRGAVAEGTVKAAVVIQVVNAEAVRFAVARNRKGCAGCGARGQHELGEGVITAVLKRQAPRFWVDGGNGGMREHGGVEFFSECAGIALGELFGGEFFAQAGGKQRFAVVVAAIGADQGKRARIAFAAQRARKAHTGHAGANDH